MPLTDDDLVRLIEKTASGDLEAWGTLWAEAVLRVSRFVARKLNRPANDPDVLDIASETFLRLRTAAASFRGDSGPMTWIQGIAKNVLRERVRADARFDIVASLNDLEEKPSTNHEPTRAGEFAQLLEQLLNDLPPAQGQALRRDLEDPSREGLLGREADTHRQNVRRALLKARELVATDPKYEKLRGWPGI